MSEATLKGKKILIFQQRRWALRIGHFLALKLKAEGCRLFALTLKKSTDKFIRAQTEVEYEAIISHDEIMEFPARFLNNRSISLNEVCTGLGIDSVWPLVNSLRNHVRSYGRKFYYSFEQNMNDDDIVIYVKALFLELSRILDSEKPDLIMAPNFVSLPHIFMCLLARKRGIPMQAVTDVKVKGYYIFTYSYNDDEGPFFDRFNALNRGEGSTNIEAAKEYLAMMNAKLSQPDYFTSKAKKSGGALSQFFTEVVSVLLGIYAYYRKGNENALTNLGITGDNRSPSIILRDFYQKKKNARCASRRSYVDLASCGRYVYFPLQFQPEAAIDVLAPFFSNQIDAVRQVAMALPGDLTLVVKDHPSALGYRSSTYLDKVANTPNVKLIDYRTPAEAVLRGAEIVISPNSTTLMEAAIFDKPGIQLGNCGTTRVIPTVVRHTDMTTLSNCILRLQQDDFVDADKKRKLINYVAAAFDSGWKFNYHGLWERDEPADMAAFWALYKSEILRLFNTKSPGQAVNLS